MSNSERLSGKPAVEIRKPVGGHEDHRRRIIDLVDAGHMTHAVLLRAPEKEKDIKELTIEGLQRVTIIEGSARLTRSDRK